MLHHPNRLEVFSTANQDNPLMSKALDPTIDPPVKDPLTPIIALDVWEHAYYLRYGPNRTDYINSWWQVGVGHFSR